MFEPGPDASMVLSLLGRFHTTTLKPSGAMRGPYKFIDDKFNLNYFSPLLTNIPLTPKSKLNNNDLTYYGQFDRNGNKEGYGEAVSYEGHHFSGFFRENAPNGEGRLIFNNGDVLFGNFKGNYVVGVAEIFYLASETIYKGEFD